MQTTREVSRRAGCHVMAKPSGAVCNLDCSYCFYLEKEKLYPERQQNWRMDDATLEQYIRQQIEAQDTREVTIAWQGGEPTLLGLDFFRRAMALQQQYGQGRVITNTLQTNGILLDDAWCGFFKQHGFLVGLSLDGPAPMHDAYRRNRAGRGTHASVMAALRCLQQHGVEYNVLCTVNNCNVHHPRQVYQFLVGQSVRHIQFIPIVERMANQPDDNGLYLVGPDDDRGARVTEWSVDGLAYGRFLAEVFDLWVQQDVGKVFVQQFEANLATTIGRPAPICVFNETCGSAFALEANGDLYACDHFVEPRHKLGNIHRQSIRQMNHSAQAHAFGQAKRDTLPAECLDCEVRVHCHGGCPKQRFVRSQSGKRDLNYLCPGYKHFFTHTAQRMRRMGDLLARGRSPAEIAPTETPAPGGARVSRNAACPCGSGKKYKHCCGQL